MNNDFVDQTIEQCCAMETTWYEGKMELEIIPRIQRQLELKGILVDHAAISERINHLNLSYMQEENPRYLVATFADGTRYKVPLHVIQDILAEDTTANGDIEISEARKQAANSPEHSLISYASTLDWVQVKLHARLIAGSNGIKKKFGWKPSYKVIMRQSEIDRFKIQKTAV